MLGAAPGIALTMSQEIRSPNAAKTKHGHVFYKCLSCTRDSSDHVARDQEP
ncbi:hypothetical protein DPMN_083735 [Dreissena polymorpha]|uniref:Uncharacterized protein n=1 Tax=Dreissena polymorpha TaxID=45954 RepID=A0A9D3YD47_DREPO|nr:hypothetical protein DPMN_083735 [Dreissena polymorpha]